MSFSLWGLQGMPQMSDDPGFFVHSQDQRGKMQTGNSVRVRGWSLYVKGVTVVEGEQEQRKL